jgi:hypothetical protein
MFEDGDATWFPRGKDIDCRAYGGIMSIKPSERRRKVNGSWKGWVWVTLNERALLNAEDPLHRLSNKADMRPEHVGQ